MKALAALLVATCVLAAGCAGDGEHLATLAKTQSCLASAGVRLGGTLDFVATTATGGALRAHLRDNEVTVVFGATVGDANQINDAYHRFRASNIGIEDVLKQQRNAVMLWASHPSDADIATITGCLK